MWIYSFTSPGILLRFKKTEIEPRNHEIVNIKKRLIIFSFKIEEIKRDLRQTIVKVQYSQNMVQLKHDNKTRPIPINMTCYYTAADSNILNH